MDGLSLVQDFAVILLVAAVAGWVMRLIGLSAVVGFLLAGIVVGPHTPPFALVTDLGRIQTASQLGLVFLMFFVGLSLSLQKIKRLGVPVVFATLVTAAIVYNLTQLFAWLVGWNDLQALVLAAALMASSSAIITKMLAESRLTHEAFARNALGMTVLEDVVAVVMLTLIGSRLGGGAEGGVAIGQTLLLLLGFVVILVVGGLLMVPRIFKRVDRGADADLKSILVTGLLFAAGVAAVHAGFSIALGAFLFGVVVAETPMKAAIERRLVGAQEMFSAMFFVAIGMLIDLTGIVEHLPMIMAVAAFALVARALAASLAFILAGAETKVAVASALVVTPIGEFSYIIAQIAVAAAVFDGSFYLIAVSASIVTAVIAPLLARYAPRIAARVDSLQPAPLRRFLGRYRGWLAWVAAGFRRNSMWQQCQRSIGLVGMELLILVGVLGFAAPIKAAIGGFLERANYVLPAWEVVFWGTLSLMVFALGVAILRRFAALSRTVASGMSGNGPRSAPLEKLIGRSLLVIGGSALLLLIGALLPIPTTVPWIPLVVIGALVPLAIFFWQRIVSLHSRFEASLQRAVEPDRSGIAGVVAGQASESIESWGVELSEMILPDQCVHAGSTIEATRLRFQFGCSIVEVERQGRVIGNPKGDFLLFPEDRLLLFGSADQVRRATAFLSEEGSTTLDESDFDEAILEILEVPHDSPRAHQSLAQLRLFNITGVQLMGIDRNGAKSLSPTASEVLSPGDRLLALGTQSELRHLQAWLAGDA